MFKETIKETLFGSPFENQEIPKWSTIHNKLSTIESDITDGKRSIFFAKTLFDLQMGEGKGISKRC